MTSSTAGVVIVLKRKRDAKINTGKETKLQMYRLREQSVETCTVIISVQNSSSVLWPLRTSSHWSSILRLCYLTIHNIIILQQLLHNILQLCHLTIISSHWSNSQHTAAVIWQSITSSHWSSSHNILRLYHLTINNIVTWKHLTQHTAALSLDKSYGHHILATFTQHTAALSLDKS